jgi:transposase
MGATIQGYGGSQLQCEAEQIVIRLPRQVFGDAWTALRTWLLEAMGRQPVVFNPHRVMTERDKGDEAPRWKSAGLDVLSWILFLLKVPAKHELVALWQTIPWTTINQLCAPLYRNAHGGRYAWAPAQMVAILTLMFLYGVAYETRTLAWIKENVVWSWFCGFGIFGPWPNRNALYDFRQRVGPELFEEALTLAVWACMEAGLVSNLLVSFDLTSVVASGHRWSPYERAVILTKAVIHYLELCWTEQRPEESMPDALRKLAAEVALEVLPHKALKRVNPERVVESVEQWDDPSDVQEPPWQEEVKEAVEEVHLKEKPIEDSLLETTAGAVRPKLVRIANKLMIRLPHTRGDLDARVGRTTDYTWFCGYLVGFVVDSLCHVITAVVLAAGNAKQFKLFPQAMDAHRRRVGAPKATAIDSAFDMPDVHTYLDRYQIKGHVTSRDHPTPADGGYGTDRLEWDEEGWILRCPNQTPLKPKGKARQGKQTYVGTACHECSRYTNCCPSEQGEPKKFTLNPVTHRRWQENRKHCLTEEYKAAQERRFVDEGRFGLAKMNHHGAKMPYRSEDMNLIAALMMAIVMNYRILARHQQQERSATN